MGFTIVLEILVALLLILLVLFRAGLSAHIILGSSVYRRGSPAHHHPTSICALRRIIIRGTLQRLAMSIVKPELLRF